ncbi:MAG: hypothetical protein K2L15_03830 [Eubacteriales bacterium]|nr:hypothetical protein [Eubacteriales bacterium]
MNREEVQENKQVKEEASLSVFIIKNLIRIIIFMGIGWLSTIGGFLWYLYQYDYVTETTTTNLDSGESGTANYINGHGNYANGGGEMNNYGKDNSTNNEETTN